jgi:ribosomal protein S12 methylthiotransferase accessory factor
MDQKTDFIEQIYDLDPGDGCPLAIVAAVLKPDPSGRRRVVSGRGVARKEALRTCLAEAAERWCAVFDETRPGVWAVEREIASDAVSPERLLLISDRQYEKADEWNRMVEPDHHLPKRREAEQPIFWVEARPLAGNGRVMVPAAHCFLGYPLAMEHGFAVPDSSGLAAGEDAASSIRRALFELIERDAVSIWWYGRVLRPALRLDRTRSSLLAKFEAWTARQGRQLWLLDLSNNLNVIVVAAISCDGNGRDLSFGFSAGWTREEACLGALGELVQFEVTKRLSRRESPSAKDWLAWCRQARIEDHPFLRPAVTGAPEPLVEVTPDMPGLVGRLRQKGIEPVAVNLNREDAPLAVVRVLAPGLRPIWPRFAPGRLYDVPVELGWRGHRLREEELNPVPIVY